MLDTQQKKKFVDRRTDEEWLADYYSRFPIRTREIYIRAILLAVEAKASELRVDVDVSDDIVSDALDSGDAGVPIGVGKESTRKETTLKLYNNGEKSSSVKRDGKVVDSFTYTAFGASFKWLKESEDPIALDVNDYFHEAASSLGLVGNGRSQIDPEIARQRREDQMARDKIQAGYTTQSNEIITQLNDYAEALYQFEYSAIEQLNIGTGTTPSDMPYPKRKHTGFSPDQLNKAYKGAVLSPVGYQFLTVPDMSEDPRLVAKKGDRIEYAKTRVEILKEHLSTYATHLKEADELYSFEDEPHPLIAAYEENYGEIRAKTAEEKHRTRIIDLDSKELKALIEDPNKEVYTKNMIVPSYNIADLENPDAKIVSGQVFVGKRKLTPKYMSINETVAVVGGDPSQKIDAIFLAEGIATAATVEEMIRFSPEYEDKNVVVLSAFDVGNFKKAGVALHHQFPDTPLFAVADNDVKIRVDSGNRPIMAADGGYTYIAADKRSNLSASEITGTALEQIAKLDGNVGAASSKFLNEYFLEHPNRDAEGEPIKPKALAFVANKGQRLTDYLIIPASPDKTGDTPIEERLKSPKQDMNDVVQNQKKVLAYDLKRFLETTSEPVTPELKGAKSKEIMQGLATTLVTNPINALQPIMGRIFDKNLSNGQYKEVKARPDIYYENESDESLSNRPEPDDLDHSGYDNQNYQPAGVPQPQQQDVKAYEAAQAATLAAEAAEAKRQENISELVTKYVDRGEEQYAAFVKDKDTIAEMQIELDEATKVLFDIEVDKLETLNGAYYAETGKYTTATERTPARQPSSMKAITEAYPDIDASRLNSMFHGALAIPDKFDFLKHDEPAGDYVTVREMADRYERVIANIAEYSEDNDLVQDFEEERGYVPEISDSDLSRTDPLLIGVTYADRVTTTEKVFIPTRSISDIRGDDNQLTEDGLYNYKGDHINGGYVLQDKTVTPAGSINNKNLVSVVSGSPDEPPYNPIITASLEDAIKLTQTISDDLDNRYENYVVLAAMTTENLKSVGEYYHDNLPSAYATLVFPNNTDIKVDADNRPVLTNDNYTYTGIDGRDISSNKVKEDARELQHQFMKNEGAVAAKELIDYMTAKPNNFAESVNDGRLVDQISPPNVTPIVINQGSSPVDFLRNPLVYIDKGASAEFKDAMKDALLPTGGYADLVNDQTIRQAAMDNNVGSSNTPESVRQSVYEDILKKPTSDMQDKIRALVRDRVESGYYEPAAVAMRATSDDAKAERQALSEKEARTQASTLLAMEAAKRLFPELEKPAVVERQTMQPTAHDAPNSNNSDFNANIKDSNTTSIKEIAEKFEKTLSSTTEIAEKYTNSYANNAFLNGFNEQPPNPEPEPQQNLQTTPQEEPTNMNRPSR